MDKQNESQRETWYRATAPRQRFPWHRVLLAVEIVLVSVWWACAFYGAWTLVSRWIGGGE